MNSILNPDTAFSSQERAELLGACLPAMIRRDRVVEIVEGGDASTTAAFRPELDRLNEQIRNAWQLYQARLPIVQLSRCPLTNEIWSHSFDPYGIDGFWWSRYKPIRLLKEPLGGQYFAFRGAIVPPTTAPVNPFLVEAGPDVPYVIERLMHLPSITAVISHTRVGELDAYPIVYFTSTDLETDKRTNDWAVDFYSFRGPNGHYEEAQRFDAEDEYSYRIEPWIEKNRVQWIEPGDTSLTLHTGTTGCPYLKLTGKKAVWRAKSGRLWWGPPGKS